MIKNFTVNINNIKNDESYRMSPKYYNVQLLFNSINEKDVLSLNNEKICIDSGSYVRKYVDRNEGIPYFRVNNEKNYIIDESNFVYVSPDVKEKMKLKENDIVFGRTQANLEKLGIFSMVDQKLAGSGLSQHVTKISIKDNYISPYYLVAYLNSKFGKCQMAYATHGDTRVELTHNQVKKIKIVLLEENLRKLIEENSIIIMSENRNALEVLAEAQKYIIEKLKLNYNKLKNNIYSVTVKDLKENDIWNVTNYYPEYVSANNFIKNNTYYKKINELVKKPIKAGIEVGSKNYLVEFEKREEDYAFIRTSDIINNSVDIYPDYFVSSNNSNFIVPKIEKGDILFSKDAKIGEVTILNGNEKIIPGSGFAIIKINEEIITPEYVFAVLSLDITLMQALQKTVIAATIPHLKIDKIGKIKIPILEKEDIEHVTQLIKKHIESNRIKNNKIMENKKILDSEFERIFEQ